MGGPLQNFIVRAVFGLKGLCGLLAERMAATHIGVHLAWIVLLTGAATFTAVGAVSWAQLKHGSVEQASALSQLSRQQIARRLEADARLAEARLHNLFAETNRQTRFLSQRLDLVKAVVSSNNVAIEAILAPASLTGELDALFVANEAGAVTGASRTLDLLGVSEALAALGLRPSMMSILIENGRTHRRSHNGTYRTRDDVNRMLGVAPGRTILHVAIEPVFDDFGDVAGVLIGLRTLAPAETTFALFSEIVQAGIMLVDGDQIVTAGGVAGPKPSSLAEPSRGALVIDDLSSRVANCVIGILGLRICAHVAMSEVEETQRELFLISEQQATGLFRAFLILAAGSLCVLVGVVLFSVRRVTRGLPQLAAAATSVSQGNLAIPFNATGLGEVRSLGRAFEVMLSNLRESVGRIGQLAFIDQVTQLSNREKMRLDITTALASGQSAMAFLFLDLDRFKSINDSFGHKTGDLLLGQLAVRLSQFLDQRRQGGEFEQFWLGRLGGDEFLVVLRGVTGRDAARNCAEAIIAKLGEVYVIGSAHLTVGTSIGIAISGEDGSEYDDLLIKADIAMYEAKRQGRGSQSFFTAQAAVAMQERLTIEQDLRAALKDGALHVAYQPMVSLSEGTVEAAEALVRWTHPNRGDISPAKFIGIAEESGLIRELGHFVLARAIADARALADAGHPIRIAVNVSVLQLEDPAFSTTVEAILTQVGLSPALLELEITETVAMRSWHLVKRQLAQLQAQGIRVAIDDFGTGYSNLSSLSQLSADTLKIDRSLVQDVAKNPDQQAIVRTILSLARALGFSTVAEGVEKGADLKFMTEAGADVAQGFYFSPALPMREFRSFLRRSRSERSENVAKIFVDQPRPMDRSKLPIR